MNSNQGVFWQQNFNVTFIQYAGPKNIDLKNQYVPSAEAENLAVQVFAF